MISCQKSLSGVAAEAEANTTPYKATTARAWPRRGSNLSRWMPSTNPRANLRLASNICGGFQVLAVKDTDGAIVSASLVLHSLHVATTQGFCYFCQPCGGLTAFVNSVPAVYSVYEDKGESGQIIPSSSLTSWLTKKLELDTRPLITMVSLKLQLLACAAFFSVANACAADK